ncbi:MAG TPA: RNA polymerase sigma factor [Acidimicrobiales bacterium]|jgi:RNA polymerase sigma-70 factor (ECF subfamily)|nr:RNA polymerase sigma factor [Acidimicrobiales bacterium]
MRLAEPTSDAALLAVAAHDPAAFEVLYLRYVRRVTAFAAKRCTSADDVADVVAQTFFRLIGAAERYEPDRADAAPFVFGIAANVLRELHRGRSRHRALVSKLTGRDLLDGDETERVEAAIDAAQQVHGLQEVLDGASPADREVLRLVAGGHTPAQAAEELGISPTAARVRLSRARRRVRDRAAEAQSPSSPSATTTHQE